ncbi:MAG: thioredoxin-disulfide reductase [Desulfobacterales bacterium]|nr:thioredoxin-disulfide reductase [Desulfobacterales bacterium]
MNTVDYDLVIIGGGPAGLTAGIYASRARLNVLMLEKLVPGGQIIVTDWIENYPGFPKGLPGADLVEKFIEQAKGFGLKIETGEVVSLDLSGPVKKIALEKTTITARAVVIATGASPKKLGADKEENFLGRGISTCATCDAPFFKDGVVAAVGGGDTAVQESLYLTKFVKKVYLIHRRDQLRAARILQERAFSNNRIEFIWNSVVTGFDGLFNLEKVFVQNVKTGETQQLDVEGCFVWVGIQPNTRLVGNALKLDDAGFIAVNARMETSAPGVFAAGDVRSTPLRQVATAVGDGAIAATSAAHYIESL